MHNPHVSAVIASFMGGFLWGLARIFTIAFAPTPAPPRAIHNAFAQAFASCISAGIGGYYVGPAFAELFHLQNEEIRGLFYVLIGIGFWQAVPGLVILSDKFLLGSVSKITGGDKTEDKTT